MQGAAAAASSGAPGASPSVGQDLEEFDMDNYDNDEEPGLQFFSVLEQDGPLTREKDPHLNGDPDSDSESDDYHEVKPEDFTFAVVSAEEESCTLEMFIYDTDEATMYVHHDLMLGAYPLCIDWLSEAQGSTGSFAAIGLFDHSVEIWDLDKLDSMTPALTLGGQKKKKKAKGKAKKRGDAKAVTAHEGPVLCLHGSPFNRSVLATGSADEAVKVWDVAANSCVHKYTHHTNKVQCARWHPTEQAVLLSAAFDRRLALVDVRQPDRVATTALPGEAESGIWSRHAPFQCLASVDDGRVVCYDVRKVASGPAEEHALWTLAAHSVACTAVCDAPAKDLLVTASVDSHAKIWNVAGSAPSLVLSKDLQAGPLFACQSSPEAPGLLCFGGKVPVMWDLTSEDVPHDVFDLPADWAGFRREAA